MPPNPALTRRTLAVGLAAASFHARAWAAEGVGDARLAAMERRIGGRLGVFARDNRSGAILLSYRANERFPMCSTFKAALAGFVLWRADRGLEQLDRQIRFGEEDLLGNSPVTRANLARARLSVRELARAAVEVSDNAAANLLLRESGGPPAMTAWLRTIGDGTTRLDRNEPTLNEALPGDPRDTTTPAAMTQTLRALVLGGSVLRPSSSQELLIWMQGAETGRTRVRAGMPQGWIGADKTGTGQRGSVNDIGLFLPPQGSPIVWAVYTTGTTAPQGQVEGVHAEIGRLIAGGGR
jgi:beta-lactamase class A